MLVGQWVFRLQEGLAVLDFASPIRVDSWFLPGSPALCANKNAFPVAKAQPIRIASREALR
jgi:hypothetical protein